MLRWLLLLLALALFGFGLLTVFKAPAWSSWKLALLAGEFGHWLAILAIVVGAAGASSWGGGYAGRGVVALLALLAAFLLARPAWQAARLSPEVASRLTAQFGGSGAGFSWSELFFGRGVEPVPFEVHAVTPELPLDYFRAQGNAGRAAPCVVVVHGGGWDSGDRHQLPGLNYWLARHGYAVAAISYRLAPQHRWPAPKEDLLLALAYLKAHAADLGLDPTRFVLLGRSAGGQVALTTAYTVEDPAVRGVVGLYAPSDLIFGYVNTTEDDMLRSPALMRQYLGGTPDSARAAYESASALFHVSRRTPPTLLVHGENDTLVWYRHSVRLDARLAEAGVPRVFVSLPWATHAIEFNLNGPGGQLTTQALAGFLAGVTK